MAVPFSSCDEPTLGNSFHGATATDLTTERMWPPEVFTMEIANVLGAARGQGMSRAVHMAHVALAQAASNRLAINPNISQPSDSDHDQAVTRSVQNWFRGACSALGIARLISELAGGVNLDRSLHVDFSWNLRTKGGVHLAKTVLARIGMAEPDEDRMTRWYEGKDVFVGLKAYSPTPGFAAENAGLRRGGLVTAVSIIKRSAWEAAGNGIKRPRGGND